MANVERPIKETGAIYEHELQRPWPLNLKERKAKGCASYFDKQLK
jgi:hypothetical protein